jgi:hypothetical protein
MSKNTHASKDQRLGRRRFIQNSSVGLVGGVTAAFLPVTAERVAATPQGGNAQTPPPPATSGVSPVPDPANATETWNEPWVWQPSAWPGQQLHLNVVENENPGATVGFGNPCDVHPV